MAVHAAPMPAWLKRHLVANGTMSETGVTDRAKAMRHRACQRTCIAGWDPLMEAWCDPAELSAFGELHAHLSGLRTYELEHPDAPARMRLRYRSIHDGSMARRVPREGNDVIVLAQHHCGMFIPPAWHLRREQQQAATFRSFNAEAKPDHVSLDDWIQFGF